MHPDAHAGLQVPTFIAIALLAWGAERAPEQSPSPSLRSPRNTSERMEAPMSTTPPSGTAGALEERLERGEVIYFTVCPFPLPEGEDRDFLLQQELASRHHKNISFNPRTEKVGGALRKSPFQAERLQQLFA